MNVWCHLPTIFKQRFALQIAGLIALCVAFITTLLFVYPSHAATGVNQTLSFQGRLSSSAGAVVPDGNYNIQFKIYQDGTGAAPGNSGGTLKWTESYVNNNAGSGVQVKNGYFSVTLGSKNPFGSSVDWNQDTLWLSMNVAGTSASCTTFGTAPCSADGEMVPMKQLTATPFALNAQRVGGLAASDLLQNSTSPQTANFNITGTGIAGTIKAATIDAVNSTDTLSIGTVNAGTVNVATNNADHTVNVATGTGTQTVVIGSTDAESSVSLQSGTGGINLATGNSSTTAAGSIGIDTGSGVPAASNIFTKTFETDVEGMESWFNSSIATSSTQKRTGAKSLAATASDTFWAVQQGYPGTSITPGHQYNISIWARAATVGRSISAQVTWIGPATQTQLGTITDSTSGWTQLAGTVTAPVGATSMIIQIIGGNGSSTAGEIHYFDDISLDDLSANSSSQSISIGTTNAQGISIGNSAQTQATNIYGGSGIKLQSGASNISLNGNTVITSGKTLTANGDVLFQNATDSATAFQIQNAGGTALFAVDTSAQTVTIGNATSGDKTVISASTGQITKYGSARNTKKITLNAEYTGSVLDPGTGTNNSGVMTSSTDLTNRMNYYKWTTSQGSNQSYDVVVQVPLPTDFDGWASSNPLSISSYTSNTTNGTITLEARDSGGTVRCNFVSVTPGSTNTWGTNSSACTLSAGTYTPGDYMTLRIRMQSPNGGDVRIGNINLNYLSKY